MNQKLFENNDYSIEATEESGCTLRVKIQVKPQQAKKAYQKATKSVNKQISIPGFRKGHAPDHSVIGRYGSYVDQEWKELVVNDAYRAALELTGVYPIHKESVQRPKIEKCSLEEGAIVVLSYEHYPQVPVIDFSTLHLPSLQKREIPEEKIEEVIEEVRRAHADWEQVGGRSAEEGDYVDVTIDSLDEDPPKNLVKERRFEITDKRLPSWLKGLLIGMDVGSTTEGKSEVDPESSEEIQQKFIPTQVRITLHSIQKILLPAIDDDLAKKAGASSLEDLKSKILQNLEKEAETELSEKKVEALKQALLESYPFDLPSSLLAAEKEEQVIKQCEFLQDKGVSDEEIEEQKATIENNVAAQVEQELRLYFLNKQIAKQGKIAVNNQELNAEFSRYAMQNPHLFAEQKGAAATKELVSRLASIVVERKAHAYALDQIESR